MGKNYGKSVKVLGNLGKFLRDWRIFQKILMK